MEIYMDSAATTPIANEVAEAIKNSPYGNPSSLHTQGVLAKEAMENTRERVSKKLICSAEEVYFTSGATEANNIAIRNFITKEKNHVICSSIEHASVKDLCEQLENEGVTVTYLDVDKQGLIDLEQLQRSIIERTAVVAVMHANNEIGTVQDIETIAKLCQKKEVAFHCDAVQSFCKVPIDLSTLPITTLSLAAHKIYGPKGVGVLFVRKDTECKPLVFGGGHEKFLRPGTENVPGIVGLRAALEVEQNVDKLTELRDYMVNRILEIPNTKLNGHSTKRICNNINICFADIEGETLLHHLNLENIYVSTGSACSSNKEDVSHVLLACGLSEKEAASSIRFSLLNSVTKEEIDHVIKVLKSLVSTLREAEN
jgi:cysteine desulfurase